MIDVRHVLLAALSSTVVSFSFLFITTASKSGLVDSI